MECCRIKGLNIEHTVCHVTGNIYALVQFSSHTPKMVVLDGYIACRHSATLRNLVSCEDICLLLSRTTQLKNSKITFQCHGLVLFFILEIILNLPLI